MQPEEWFSTELDKGLSRVTQYSSAAMFVDAEAYYADLRREVEAAGEGHFVYWIGFEAGAQVPMPTQAPARVKKPYSPRDPAPGDLDWFDVLKAAGERKVQVRALLNLHPTPAPNDKYKGSNFELVERMNREIPNCGAINDFRYLWLNGTHHQKLVLVYNAAGLLAYCGTCDVEAARIKDVWCELQGKFMGEAAAELYEVFASRWREHTGALRKLGSENSHLKPLDTLRKTAPRSGNLRVQVGTTYGNPQRSNPLPGGWAAGNPDKQWVNSLHRVEIGLGRFAPAAALPQAPRFLVGNDFFTEKDTRAAPFLEAHERGPRAYAFAPKGHTGIYHMLRTAIEHTQETIYLEDQYLVGDEKMGPYEAMLDLLVRKVKEKTFKKLVIFCTRIDEINEQHKGTAWAHRRNFVEGLLQAGGEKVVVCQYKSKRDLKTHTQSAAASPFYIHSKTWVFDDLLLVSGSANCNRRGYSHDSELDYAVYDLEKRFVKEVRVRLWLNRLNTQEVPKPIAAAELQDFLSAARYWEEPEKWGLAIENSRRGVDSLQPVAYPDKRVEDLASLYGASRDPAQAALRKLLEYLKAKGFWDIAADPDGS